MARDPDTPRWHLAFLVLLTLGCVALRWTGIDYGLPHSTHNDEIVYLSQYRALTAGDPVPEARRRFNAYPSVWMRAAVTLPRSATVEAAGDLEAELAETSSDFVFLRRCVALLACLVVPATWMLARRFLDSGWSLVAAALAGTSVLGFCLSTQARPHAVVAGAIVLAVVAAIDVARKGTLGASLLAGLACGVALAMLQSGAATLLPLAAAHALRLRTDGKRAIGRFVLALAVMLPVFLFAYPAVLANLLARPYAGGTGHGFLASHGVVLSDFRGGGTAAVYRAFAYHDPLLLLAAGATLVGGTVLALRRKWPLRGSRDELLVVLAFCVPFLVALCLFERTFYRFALPLFPFAALFAVLGLLSLGRIGVAAGGALVAAQLLCVVQVAHLHVAKDTAQQAAAWIQEHVDRESAHIAISPWIDLPLVRNQAALALHGLGTKDEVQPWLDHQREMSGTALDALGWSIVDLPLRRAAQRDAFLADPHAFVRGLSAEYLVIDAFEGDERPLLSVVREAARSEGQLVARFAPQGPDSPHPHQIEPFAGAEGFPDDRFAFQILGAEALGMCLEIYRFER